MSASLFNAVHMTEQFDSAMANYLLRQKPCPLSADDAAKLRKYVAKAGKTNRVEVVYQFGRERRGPKDCYGRLYPQEGISYANLPRNVRGALGKDYYWDLDIVNAQPTFLAQYAKKREWDAPFVAEYCERREERLQELMEHSGLSRDEAKKKVISLFYGSRDTTSLTPFFAKLVDELILLADKVARANPHIRGSAKNPLGSTMALVLQEEERKCLFAMVDALRQDNRQVDCLIFDGALVQKRKDETAFPEGALVPIEKAIEAQTGYKVHLKASELTSPFVREEVDEVGVRVEEGILINDAYAAEKFAEWMGPHLVLDGETLYCFDTTSGMWRTGGTELDRAITRWGKEGVFLQGDSVYDYSGDHRKGELMKKKLPTILPVKTDYFLSRSASSMFKLLFKDGIYDMLTGEFRKGFDPEVVFEGGVPRNFPVERDAEREAEVHKVLFEDPFADGDVGQLYKWLISQGVAGNYLAKRFGIALGGKNCSKGTITNALMLALGSQLVGALDTNSLLHKDSHHEAARENGPYIPLANKRVVIGNEVQMSPNEKARPLDGNKIKMLASGGDTMVGRATYGVETRFVFKPLMLFMANNLPPFSPSDDALRSRMVAIEFDYTFVEHPNPENPCEKPARPNLAEFFMEEKSMNALLWILLDEVYRWNECGRHTPDIPETCRNLKEDTAPNDDNMAPFLEGAYIVTRDEKDWVPFTEVRDHIRAAGCKLTDVGIALGLKMLGCVEKRKSMNGRQMRGRAGLRKVGE